MRKKQEKKINHKMEIHKMLMTELLDNNKSVAGYVGKRLKNITEVSDEELVDIFEEHMPLFKRKVATISHPIPRINYIFKVIENHINNK